MTSNPEFLQYFDSRFKPRDVQVEALSWLSNNWADKRFKILNIPTAGGKSFINMALASYYASQGKTVAILTAQRSLQAQFQRDFAEVNLLMGAQNYKCIKYANDKHFTADMAKSLKFCAKCEDRPDCPYFIAKQRTYDELITFFNPLSYLYLLKKTTMAGSVETLYKPSVIILDEVQSITSMLAGIFDVKIWRHDFKYKKNVSASVPKVVETLEQYVDSLSKLFISKIGLQERIKVRQTMDRVGMLIKGLKEEAHNFVVEEAVETYRKADCDCLRIRSICPPRWILDWFFGDVPHVLATSGTVFETTIQELGITKDEYKLLYLPSPIPAEQRLFYPLSAVNNSYSNKAATEQVAEAIKQLIRLHPNERGLVLASYDQAAKLKELLYDSPRFVFMDRDTKGEVIAKFCRGECAVDAVAILSGAWEGIDLKDDLCRFIIITKCLFPSIKDKVVKRRMEVFKDSYQLDTLEIIIQGANRASRNENDRSVTYMLDSNFNNLYAKMKAKLPPYFVETVKWGNTIATLLKKAGLL